MSRAFPPPFHPLCQRHFPIHLCVVSRLEREGYLAIEATPWTRRGVGNCKVVGRLPTRNLPTSVPTDDTSLSVDVIDEPLTTEELALLTALARDQRGSRACRGSLP